MSDRQELVTTALLGTDRRPLPSESGHPEVDPALLLLDEASRSAAATRAGAPLPRQPPGPQGPAQSLALAPRVAQDLCARLLLRPQPGLVNLWLAAAVRHGCGLAPAHWATIAGLAARSTEIDRSLVRAALGDRGQWFLRQNPQWARLATQPPPSQAPSTQAPSTQAEPTTTAPPVDGAAVRIDPDAILRAPQPWSVELIQAALEVIGSLRLGYRTSNYAAAVGVRLPPGHQPLVASAAEFYRQHQRLGLGTNLVRDAFAALDDAVATRAEIDHAFASEPDVPHQQESP